VWKIKTARMLLPVLLYIHVKRMERKIVPRIKAGMGTL